MEKRRDKLAWRETEVKIDRKEEQEVRDNITVQREWSMKEEDCV